MSRTLRITAALAVFTVGVLFVAPLHAQDIAQVEDTVAVSSAPTAAVVFTLAPLALSWAMQAPLAATILEAPLTPKLREPSSTNTAMMIVGGAALIVGSTLDGDGGTLIMLGGGIVGLIGLFNHLK